MRGDTDFSLTEHLDRWDERCSFVFGFDARPNMVKLAEGLAESQWEDFIHKPKYEVKTQERQRPENVKEQIVKKREFKNIRTVSEQVAEFSYRPGKCKKTYRVIVLRKNLSVERGEVINILGASGAGKSTLLYILGALDRPTSGTVIHDGVSLFTMGDRDLAAFRNRRIGFVFQFHHLLPEFTAIENVMMPALIARIKPAEARHSAEAILDRLGLAHRRDHKPGELSGGEQQRVAVARAILLSPDVILADEPTGNLDTKTGEEVHTVLMDLNRELKITMIIVTHNLKLAKRDGRSMILEDGKIKDGR